MGVEEEFLVIHPDRAAPRPVGDAVAARAGAGSDGQFEHELMREQAELATEPHAAAADLHDDLRRRRGELARAAAESGTRLAALATSPRPAQPHLTPDSRYVRMLDTFGGVAAAQLTCGMHVHVSVDTPEDGVLALDGLRPWLPVLLALTGNSPYWRGEDTAYESFRTVLWGQWPTAGRVPAVASPDEYERLVSDLVTSGAASDDGMIYFDARLSRRYPTVEVRVCDVTPYADDAVTVAVLLRALVTAAVEERVHLRCTGIQPQLLTAAAWRAARWGMAGELLDVRDGARLVPAWDLLADLVSSVAGPLEATGDRELVDAGLERIRRRGTGADLQRRAFAETGSFEGVVDGVCETTAPT